MEVEKNKLMKILNQRKEGKNFISEILQFSKKPPSSNHDELYSILCMCCEFVSDDNGDGFHEKKHKLYFIEGSELRESLRDINIDILLNENVEDMLNIESKIYTESQLAKLSKLRNNNKTKHPDVITKHDYYGKFKVGTKVIYKNESSVITFLHKPKEDGDLRFTVKLHGKEIRYVNPFNYTGTLVYKNSLDILKRKKKEDYSGIEINQPIKDMSTEQLLKELGEYRRVAYCSNTGIYIEIKAELSIRNHVPRKNEKKAKISKKHGGAKSKNR